MNKSLRYIFSLTLICFVTSYSFGQQDGDNSAISIVWTDQNASVSIPSGANGNRILSLMAGSDLDKDGLKEIIAVVITNDMAAYRHICVFEATGNDNAYELVWQYEFPDPASAWHQNSCMGDLDGDGVLEIIVVGMKESSDNHPEIYVFEYSGADNTYGTAGGTQPSVSWDLDTPVKDDIRCIAAGDLDGDGRDELITLVAAAYSQPAISVASIDNFTDQNWTIEFGTDQSTYSGSDLSAVAICDLDDDGHKEAAFIDLTKRLGFVEYENSEYQLTVVDINLPIGDYKPGLNALGARDVNGDGQEELYFSCWAGGLFYVVSLLPGWEIHDLTSDDIYLIGEQLDTKMLGGSVICDWDHGLGSDGMDYLVGCGSVAPGGEKLPEICDWEYIGGEFGYVTDSRNYQFHTIINETQMVGLLGEKVSLDRIAYGGDMDGDGKNEIVFGRSSSRADMQAIFVAEFSGPSPVIDTKDNLIPHAYTLLQNYPNPFNNSTVIEFNLQEQGKVSLKVYNHSGQEVSSLMDEEMAAGAYKVPWVPVELASDIYFYTISVNGFKQTRKLLFLK